MPLIDMEKQGDYLSNKQMRNLKKYNDLQEGDGFCWCGRIWNSTEY